MQVRVKLMRNAGRWLTWNQKPREFAGSLLCGRSAKSDEPGLAYLYVLGEGGPQLFDPKVKSVSGNEMRISGLEKVDYCWVLQEWNCEILSVE